MNRATLDPSKNLDLYFRKYRNGTKVLTFLDVTGADYDLTGVTFSFRAAFAVSLVVVTNTITLTFLETEVINRERYFWELVNTTTGKTWLCGTAFFTDGLSAESTDTEEITIALNGDQVTITINESGGTGDVNGGTA